MVEPALLRFESRGRKLFFIPGAAPPLLFYTLGKEGSREGDLIKALAVEWFIRVGKMTRFLSVGFF